MGKHTISKIEKVMYGLYILGILGIGVIFIALNITRQEPENQEKYDSYTDISEHWFYDKEQTKPVYLTELNKHMDEDTGILTIYYQLPDLQQDVSFIYRSKDVYTRAYINGEMIYETSVYESKYYNASPGNLWNIATIPQRYSKGCLEIQIEMVYDSRAVIVDSLYLGDKADIILGLFRENMPGLVISLLLILIGLVLVVSDILPAYKKSKTNHAIFWVGLFAIIAGAWSAIETNMIQFCVGDMRILQLTNNILLTISTMPVLFYLNSEYQIFKYRIMRILGYVTGLYTLLCVGVQLSGIGDWHHMFTAAIILMMISDVILTIWMIGKFITLKKNNEPILNCVLQLTGFFLLCLLNTYEAIRSLQVDRVDRAELMRIGMLVLCICLAISNQIETYKLLEQGLKFDLIRKLAYSDGLTELGNRTAYLEQLEEYAKGELQDKQLGIIYLDVNNLKKVNDNQGHEYGDQLIQIAARIIEDSFGHYGKAYRIGGDEFCVLMTGDNLDDIYNQCLAVFKELIIEANQASWYPFDIKVANGFVICKEFTKEKIDDAIAQADSKMYEDKMLLKNS